MGLGHEKLHATLPSYTFHQHRWNDPSIIPRKMAVSRRSPIRYCTSGGRPWRRRFQARDRVLPTCRWGSPPWRRRAQAIRRVIHVWEHNLGIAASANCFNKLLSSLAAKLFKMGSHCCLPLGRCQVGNVATKCGGNDQGTQTWGPPNTIFDWEDGTGQDGPPPHRQGHPPWAHPDNSPNPIISNPRLYRKKTNMEVDKNANQP